MAEENIDFCLYDDTSGVTQESDIHNLTMVESNQVQQNVHTIDVSDLGTLTLSNPSQDLNSFKFIMCEGVTKCVRKPKRCRICLDAGQDGYGCPGRNDRSKCPLSSLNM
jgi:hypothetical protein